MAKQEDSAQGRADRLCPGGNQAVKDAGHALKVLAGPKPRREDEGRGGAGDKGTGRRLADQKGGKR